ncbi:MAG TPA: 2-polyprenyl-3-methyl-6-methoxy-1,4-benzoquinone monooxygenase [Gammaproteobacteria bacterium]|nr:2-polyprenyl-3-methyl-6-methoxy-1,4-benzoquinone monooxygenase [Gammaproteobacteria bacterium]
MTTRTLSPLDRLVINVDRALRTVFGRPQTTERPDPAATKPEPELSATARKTAASLMRVNHTGEVCAQALYQGQALTAKLPDVREKMERAALEENDHLDWCERRIRQLNSHTSYLNPLWYGGSFAIGALAGLAGDKWSLGFVVETERQVVKHLDGHLARLPEQDQKSRAVLEQMREDELRHATTALAAGGAALPAPIKTLMTLTSKVMTKTAYRL